MTHATSLVPSLGPFLSFLYELSSSKSLFTIFLTADGFSVGGDTNIPTLEVSSWMRVVLSQLGLSIFREGVGKSSNSAVTYCLKVFIKLRLRPVVKSNESLKRALRKHNTQRRRKYSLCS